MESILKTPLSETFITEMKSRLLEEKTKLQNDLTGLQPHEELGDDIDSSAQEVEDDEASQDIMTKVKADLVKIEKALAKIEQGTYGLDDDGKFIGEERLRAIPWADKAL